MYNKETTEMMLQAVESAGKTAKSADAEYERGARKIQSMASQQIQLGVGTAVSKASRIADLVRKTNDDLYATLQMLVGLIDSQCRPLLDQDPDPSAIRRVKDMIKHLNDESKIKTDFTASVNDVSRGKVVAVSYRPTIENQMIEKFWETVYQNHPERIASEKAERDREKEEKKKKEADAKAANEACEKEFEGELAKWSVKRDEILAKRSAEVEKELSLMKTERQADIEARYEESVKKANKGKIFNENNIKHHEKALATLSAIHFLKRKDHREKLDYARQGLAQMEAAVEEAEMLHKKECEGLSAWVESKRAELAEKTRERYPIPKKPRKTTYYTDPQKLVDELAQGAIYEEMEPGKKYTPEDLMELVPMLADMTRARVLGHLRMMIGVDIERIEEDRTVYFRLLES